MEEIKYQKQKLKEAAMVADNNTMAFVIITLNDKGQCQISIESDAMRLAFMSSSLINFHT